MMIKLLSAFGLMIGLSGCAAVVATSSSDPQQDKFQAVAQDMAARAPVSDVASASIPWREASRKFSLGRRDQLAVFDEGKAYFKAIQLPPESAGKRLEIRSYYSLDFPTTLLVPSLIFLDSSKQVLEKRPTPAYKIVNGFGEHIQLVETIPASAALVIVYTTPARTAERMTFQTYRMTGVLPSPSFEGKDTGFGGFYEGILRLALIDP